MQETRAATKQKADVFPPPAPKKGGTKDKPICSNDFSKVDEAHKARLTKADEAYEERQAMLQELLTPLPPDATAANMERRSVLLEEEAIRTEEKTEIWQKESQNFARDPRAAQTSAEKSAWGPTARVALSPNNTSGRSLTPWTHTIYIFM